MLPEIQKANFGDSCWNLKTQVLPSDARSHHHNALFRPIQTRDDKGAYTGDAKFFDERNNSTLEWSNTGS